jgi:isopentenyl diphosphate isomerase/L-lactate dehydrogenase-like FMN-dependent dehydrogenase
MDRLFNMILRQVMRKLVNRAANAGFDTVSRSGDATQAGRKDHGKQAALQTRRAMRMASRMSRM